MNQIEQTSSADGSEGSGTVVGRVMADGHAVEDATVMIVEGHASHPDIAAITDATGAFQLGGLSSGWYNLEARAGTRTARGSVELNAGDTTWLELVLR